MTNYVETRDDNIFPWLLVLLEGIAAVILGILMLTAPGVTLFILVQVLGIFLLIAGIFRIVSIFIDSSSWEGSFSQASSAFSPVSWCCGIRCGALSCCPCG